MKLKTAKRWMATGVAMIIFPLAACNFWIYSLTKQAAVTVRPAARAVLNAYYLSKLTGAYWENELENQAERVALLKQIERLDFYRVILLNCELDTTKAMVFSANVKPDAIALRNDLIKRMRAGEFSTNVDKTRANTWIIKLKDIDEVG
jgi:hypothetical protein